MERALAQLGLEFSVFGRILMVKGEFNMSRIIPQNSGDKKPREEAATASAAPRLRDSNNRAEAKILYQALDKVNAAAEADRVEYAALAVS
jgi:hypothetical protein